MPSVDSGRQRVRLSGAHLDVAARLLEGRPVTADVTVPRDELHVAGLLPGGAPHPLLSDLIGDLAAAQVTLDIEVSGRDGTSVHGAVLTGSRCWLSQGWVGSEESEYALIDPRLLPSSVGLVIGLHQYAETSPAPSEVRTTLEGLDAAFAARGQIEAALAGGADLAGVAGTVRDAVAALPAGSPELGDVLAAERCAWRVTSASRAGEDVVVRGLAVLDAREHGLWERVAPAEPLRDGRLSPDTEVVLVRRSPAELWRSLGALLPAGSAR